MKKNSCGIPDHKLFSIAIVIVLVISGANNHGFLNIKISD